jgi:hypothetical protein
MLCCPLVSYHPEKCTWKICGKLAIQKLPADSQCTCNVHGRDCCKRVKETESMRIRREKAGPDFGEAFPGRGGRTI